MKVNEFILEFIKEALPSWDLLPVYKLNETIEIIEFFRNKLEKEKPLLIGLVLAGAKSFIIGYDKGLIDWNGKRTTILFSRLFVKHLCSGIYFMTVRSAKRNR